MGGERVSGVGAQARVADADERFALLVAAVHEYAIFLLTADGTVTSWNPGAEHLKGYTADEIVGKSFAAFYTPEDRAAGVPVAELEVARTHGSFIGEGWRVRRDGTRFWGRVVITALFDPDGSLRGYAKVTRDETAARAAREREVAIEEITSALLAGRSAAEALDVLVVHARTLVGAGRAWVSARSTAPEGALRVLAADGPLPGPAAGTSLPLRGSIAERVMAGGEPVLVADFPAESSSATSLAGMGSALVVPLVAGTDRLGVLVAAMPAGGPVASETDLEVLKALGRQASVILAYERLQQALRDRLIDDDRERIARDMHDHVIQQLFATGLTLQSAAARAGEESLRATLTDAVRELDETIRRLRQAIFELQRPGGAPVG